MNIFDASEEARNALLQREKRQAVYFITEFRKIQDRLKIQIDQTLIEIEKGRLAGEISPALISTNLRLNNLLNAITAEIDTLSRPFARHIADGQAAAIDTAKETARKVLPPEITASFQVFDAEATKQLIGIAGNGQPLFTLFEKLGTPVRQAVFDALFYGMATGAANQTIARDIREAVGTGAVNAMTIARTETNRAYREASREFYDATPAVIGWRWMSARDLTTCPVCWSMHGRVFPTSTKFGSHPNCRCVSVPVFVDSAPVETGSNLFGNLTPAQQKAILGPRRFDMYGQGARLRDFVETYESPFGIGRRVKTLENTTFKPRLSAPASS